MEFRSWIIPLRCSEINRLTIRFENADSYRGPGDITRWLDMQYQRKDRVGDLIKREIAQIVQSDLKDPGIGFVTITAVEVSADLKQARVFYSVLGDEESKKRSASALRRATGFIQNEIGGRLRLKYTPEVIFHFDKSVEYGAHIEELIEKIHHTERPKGDQPDQSETEADNSTQNGRSEDE
jgi:ribosome-binding factor A